MLKVLLYSIRFLLKHTNQNDFLGCISDKPLHKLEKRFCVHGVFIDHKVNLQDIPKRDSLVKPSLKNQNLVVSA